MDQLQSICERLKAMLERNEALVEAKRRRAQRLREHIAKLEANPDTDPETIAALTAALQDLEGEIGQDEQALAALRDDIRENCS